MSFNLKVINRFKRVLTLAVLTLLLQPALIHAKTMVHVHYNGVSNVVFGALTPLEFYKSSCDDFNKIQASLGKSTPFKVKGNINDFGVSTTDLYISIEDGYQAEYKHSYSLSNESSACDVLVVPNEVITISRYKQRDSYNFDSSLPTGEQWSRSEMLDVKTGATMAKSFAGFLGLSVKSTGRKEKVANLLCEVAETTSAKPGFTTNSCIWRASPKENLNFLGSPLELALRANSQTGKDNTTQDVADKVDLKAPYRADVFQVPKAVLNMPFYPIEPKHTKYENHESDLDCPAEKKKTGINPCAGPIEAAKWCAVVKKNTGKDPCEIVEDDSSE